MRRLFFLILLGFFTSIYSFQGYAQEDSSSVVKLITNYTNKSDPAFVNQINRYAQHFQLSVHNAQALIHILEPRIGKEKLVQRITSSVTVFCKFSPDRLVGLIEIYEKFLG